VILGGQSVVDDLSGAMTVIPPEPFDNVPPAVAPEPTYNAPPLPQIPPPGGFMQQPDVQRIMQQNLLSAMGGLSRDIAAVDRDEAMSIQRNKDDALRANFLMPLLGFTKGNLKMSMDASRQLRDAIDERSNQRSSHRADRMDILRNLSKVVQDADPNDLDYLLKKQKAQIDQQAENRRLNENYSRNYRFNETLAQRKAEAEQKQKAFQERLAAMKAAKADDIGVKKQALAAHAEQWKAQLQAQINHNRQIEQQAVLSGDREAAREARIERQMDEQSLNKLTESIAEAQLRTAAAEDARLAKEGEPAPARPPVAQVYKEAQKQAKGLIDERKVQAVKAKYTPDQIRAILKRRGVIK
jgi:hypothetical protein